jgi:hypothetical protein
MKLVIANLDEHSDRALRIPITKPALGEAEKRASSRSLERVGTPPIVGLWCTAPSSPPAPQAGQGDAVS